jgi:hypothetical protein
LARWKLANLTLGYDVNPFQGKFLPEKCFTALANAAMG